jgi:hypothetical protein
LIQLLTVNNALAADAAEALTEDFLEFLFPDAADADAPQA